MERGKSASSELGVRRRVQEGSGRMRPTIRTQKGRVHRKKTIGVKIALSRYFQPPTMFPP